jgi:hypothetical protein
MKMNKNNLKPFFKKHIVIMRIFAIFNLIFFPIICTIDLWKANWSDIKDVFTILGNSLLGRWSK